jgi:hypothetical protein
MTVWDIEAFLLCGLRAAEAAKDYDNASQAILEPTWFGGQDGFS